MNERIIHFHHVFGHNHTLCTLLPVSVVKLYVWRCKLGDCCWPRSIVFFYHVCFSDCFPALNTALVFSSTHSEFVMLANVNWALYIYIRAAPAAEEIGNKSSQIKPNNDIVYLLSISLIFCYVSSLALGHVEAFSQTTLVLASRSRSHCFPDQRKARCLLLAGFKRSQFIFPPALLASLNCLFFFPPVVLVGGKPAFKHNKGWSLSQVGFSSAAVARRKPLISSLFCSVAAVFVHEVDQWSHRGRATFWCEWRTGCAKKESGRSHFSMTDDLQTFVPSAWCSSSSNKWQLVTLFLFSFNIPNWHLVPPRQGEVLWLTVSWTKTPWTSSLWLMQFLIIMPNFKMFAKTVWEMLAAFLF